MKIAIQMVIIGRQMFERAFRSPILIGEIHNNTNAREGSNIFDSE